jgi:Zn-finger nucleic acid-binding protein
MKCPRCKEITLLIADKQGVEIDYCPECRGIWLDRGELEKIIERTTVQPPRVEREYERRGKFDNDHNDHHERDYDDDHSRHYGDNKQYKKKSFLKDLFDF